MYFKPNYYIRIDDMIDNLNFLRYLVLTSMFEKRILFARDIDKQMREDIHVVE